MQETLQTICEGCFQYVEFVKAIPQPCLLCLVFFILSISLQPIQASRPYLLVGGVRGSELRGEGEAWVQGHACD
jgi:hypothetical protein